jgi:hypothetical protein
MLRRRLVAFSVLALRLPAAATLAQVNCTESGAPPNRAVTLHLEIDRPLSGEAIEATDACTRTVEVAGVFAMTGDVADPVDFYLMLDASGRTGIRRVPRTSIRTSVSGASDCDASFSA